MALGALSTNSDEIVSAWITTHRESADCRRTSQVGATCLRYRAQRERDSAKERNSGTKWHVARLAQGDGIDAASRGSGATAPARSIGERGRPADDGSIGPMAAHRTNGDTAILPRHANLKQALKPEAADLADRGTVKPAAPARPRAAQQGDVGAPGRWRYSRPVLAQQAACGTTGRRQRDVAMAAPRYGG